MTKKIFLVPIRQTKEENPEFVANPDCLEILQMSIDFYKSAGYDPPWICYFAYAEGVPVGSAAYIGKPVDNRIEIAYGTMPAFRNKGIGGQICHELLRLAQEVDPSLTIIAKTLKEENFSTKILRKNGFRLMGTAWDKDEGEVWEWVYEAQNDRSS